MRFFGPRLACFGWLLRRLSETGSAVFEWEPGLGFWIGGGNPGAERSREYEKLA